MFAIALMGLVIEQKYVDKIPNEWLRGHVAGWFEEEKNEKGEVTGYRGYVRVARSNDPM